MLIIRNVRVQPVTSPVLERGAVVVENGVIKGVVQDTPEALGPFGLDSPDRPPSHGTVVDGEGGLLLPGFIDAHTHLGLRELGVGAEGNDVNESTNPVNPDLRAIDGINPAEEGLRDAVRTGVTSACVLPGSANVVGGQCVVIRTSGTVVDRMVVRENVGMKVAFGENPTRNYRSKGRRPATRMAVAAMLRETLTQARNYAERKARSGRDFSETNLGYEALLPVLRGEIPLRVHAHRADDIATALRIAREFGLRMILEHGTDAVVLVDELVEYGVPIIIGPTLCFRGKVEVRGRRFEAAAFMTDHPFEPIELLPVAAGLAIRAGMPEFEALKALTITPARILGIDDKIGSIEVGKDADLALWSGNPFDLQSKVKRVWIQGKSVL